MASKDILLPAAGGSRGLVVAFVPIAVALIGIGFILFGGISARDSAAATAFGITVDATTTGSVTTPAEQRRILEMLDR